MSLEKPFTVMGFGTFDHFHPGHLFYLKELKKLGGYLVVVIARDRSVTRIKAVDPTHSEKERLEVVREAKLADEVVLGHHDDFYQVLRDYKPSVIGLGYDQNADESKILEVLPGVEIVRLAAFKPEVHKSSYYRNK